MSVILAQVSFEHDSGLPRDRAVNTFHFKRTDGLEGTAYDNIFDMVTDFYTADHGGYSVQQYLSRLLTGAGRVKLYDLGNAPPRFPVFDETFTVANGNDALPSEVAICVSFQAAPVSGVPMARKRGRVYVGPLTKDALYATTGRPFGPMLTMLAAAGNQLMQEADASISWDLVIHSAGARDNSDDSVPYKDRAKLAVIDSKVVSGWVDDDFDTQRRRGIGQTARNTFTL